MRAQLGQQQTLRRRVRGVTVGVERGDGVSSEPLPPVRLTAIVTDEYWMDLARHLVWNNCTARATRAHA